MNRELLWTFLASLLRHRLATALALLAIALGVALGLAVQLIHRAALDEFGRGMRLLAGEADLQVLGPRGGFDEALYLDLARRPEVAQASPVLEIAARVPGAAEPLTVLGVDPFRAARLYPQLVPVVESDGRLAVLRPDRIFLSAAAAEAYGVTAGAVIAVQAGLNERRLHVAGWVPGAGAGRRIAVMDIAAAQASFAQLGRLSRIDLRLAPGTSVAAARDALRGLLPPGVELLQPEQATRQTAALSRAYRVNLSMLAAIALLTGGFLVFSTQLLSVVRRRQAFALLRALGLEARTLVRGLLAEGATVGLVGGALGVLLGYGLTAAGFALVGGDLGAGYFEGLAPALRFEPGLSLAYLLLGVAAGVLGAWLPAREALRSIPARALRAGADSEALPARGNGVAAAACLAGALLCALLPPVDDVPVFGYAAVLLILIGALLLLPAATRLGVALLPARRPLPLRLAHARLAAAPGQTLVASAGVLASVALAVAMAIMVGSFRVSVDDWLARMLPADVYLRAAAGGGSGVLEPRDVDRVAALPGVSAVDPLRFEQLRLLAGRHPVTLIARRVGDAARLPLVEGDPTAVAESGVPPVWISEALADFARLGVGATLDLPLAGARHRVRVAGIWRDYARQHGALILELADYRRITGDARSDDLAIHLHAGARPEAVVADLRALFGERAVEVALPGEIRATSLAIFDRTFLVTYLMEGVAVLIGLFGISTGFAALATSRRKEFGMLRHLGLRRREVGRLLAVEGALSAAAGVVVGGVAGGAVALVLVEVINRQSFHWSMDLHPPWGMLGAFAVALVLLAALAARLSGYQAMRQDAVLAVREDW